MEPHYYNVNLNWIKERSGLLHAPELNEEIEVATPPPFPKGTEGIWSPEHLFTAAVNSCFMTTFLAIAENSRLDFTDFSCAAKGKLEQIDGKYLLTEVLLEAKLKIPNEADLQKAERILHKSEQACLISNSIKANVVLQTEITF